jgi:subtilisin family serine protease
MLVVAFPAAGAGDPANAGPSTVAIAKNGIYIVQLAADPVVAYDGGLAGYKATSPKAGEKIDPQSPDVVRYVGYLKSAHDNAVAKVGGQKVYDYSYSYDGFAAKLNPAQAGALAKQSGVLAVTPDELVTQDTSSTPSFLGLDAPGGLWEQLGGASGDKKDTGAGEGMIIGDIDSGIWPESKSFSDRDSAGKLAYQQIPGWHGKCVPGEDFDASMCNQKLIGARYYNASQGGNAGIDADNPWEFNSVRDYNGHGTHTASTAGGNNGVQATGPAAAFGKVSGMAPRARIAAYKALWSTEDAATASGGTADLVAAIDQAVADGVDVINYSISGTQTNFLDPVEVSFLFAEVAGIFVSESAGNSGPTTSTVAHPSPWTTTVAAGTHNRSGTGSITLGNGVTYTGASVAAKVGPAPLIDSTAAGLSGADATKVELCYSKGDNAGAGVLDPAKVAGKIVICKRGVTARVNKSLAVLEAGGVGMVLYNDPDSSLNADFHFVPTVHVDKASGLAIKAYAATASPTATINNATLTYNAPAPFTASFSSRGPLRAGGGDLLKPDVIAPGQDILAAVAPPGNHGFDFNLYSGTSMSAPHVTGLAALLMQLHPNWSPMAVKSALMTSASDVLDGPNTNPLVIFRQGAGHVRPNSAADPGLVYDAGFDDFRAFLRSQKLCTFCFGTTPAAVIDPSDMNVPSIAIGDLAGVQTVTRRVTNVGSAAATYTASVSGLSGLTTVVTPSSLTLNPGETKSFTVAFTRTTATLNAYAGGQLTWTDGKHNVRIPVVVRPVAIAAPAEVTQTGTADLAYAIKTGYDGTLAYGIRGLVPAAVTSLTVPFDPLFNSADPRSTNAPETKVTIAAGIKLARFSLFEGEALDLDLYVYKVGADSKLTLVGSSTSGSANEQVQLVDSAASPIAGDYAVFVDGFDTGGAASVPAKLYTWQLGTTDAGNMTATGPTTATTGGTGTVTLHFTGLATATRYLGAVDYSDGTNTIGTTLVRINTP